MSKAHLPPPVETFDYSSREQTIKILTLIWDPIYGPLREWTHKRRRWFIRSSQLSARQLHWHC